MCSMDYIPDEQGLYDYVARHDRSHLRGVQHFVGEMNKFEGYNFEKWADLLTNIFRGSKGGQRFYHALIHDREGLRVLAKRYLLMNMLVDNDLLDRENLRGNIVDVGCYKGASSDALALFGGLVYGVDPSGDAKYTISGRRIISDYGGKDVVRWFSSWWPEQGPINLVTCFHADSIDKKLGFAQRLCKTALEQLADGGQVLMTFDQEARIDNLECQRGSQIKILSRIASQIPMLLGSSDRFIYVVRKPSEEDSTQSIDPEKIDEIVGREAVRNAFSRKLSDQ